MNTIALGKSGLKGSQLAYGCWRIAGRGSGQDLRAGRKAVRAAVDAGYTLFDHANIYGGGACESLFGEVLRDSPGLRDTMLITTKCGIRFPGDPNPTSPYRYDFSADHIERSCEASLKRLGIETIDLYQLHRPDYLMQPEEVAAAFRRLQSSGKVRHFGVSNFRPSQLALLQQACDMPLAVNQVEISLAQQRCLEDGTLDQCLQEGITPMAWSPLGGGHLADGARDVLPSQEGYQTAACVALLDELAAQHHTTRVALALSWLLGHPSGIVPIVGSVRPERIREAAAASASLLSREEWYRLLVAGRGEGLA